jgi:hypothetical protein
MRASNKKEAEAIQKKLFLKSLKNLMEVLDIGELYKKIPPAEKKLMARTRFRTLRVEVEEGAQVNSKDLRTFREITSMFLKNICIAFGSDDQRIYLHDYYTAGHTFMAHFNDIDESSFDGAGELKAVAKEFESYMLEEDNPFTRELARLIHGLLFLTSRPDRHIYSIRMGFFRLYSGGNMTGLSVCLYVSSQQPVKRQVILEKKKRVAFRVGVPDYPGENVAWVTFPRNFLLSGFSQKHGQLDLYIQSHALHRFDERTRGLGTDGSLRLSLNHSLEDPAVVEYKDGSGLLAFTHEEKRFGYFLFTLLDDMLLLRTFLFLTNTGTPEGKKLDKLLGIRKIDKQYLELDTAYAFMNTDLLNSPWLCDLLVEAGCEQLCDIAADTMEDSRKAGYALDAARYLGLPETVYSELV